MLHDQDRAGVRDSTRIRLTRWSAEFADRELEASYRESTFPAERAALRAAAVVVFVVDVLVLLFGKLIQHHPTSTLELIGQALALTIILTLYLLLGRKRRLDSWRAWTAISGLTLIVAIATMIACGYGMNYRGSLLIPSGVLAIYLVVRLNLVTLAGFTASYSVLTFCAWLSTLEASDFNNVMFMLILVVLANLFGYVESRRLQRERRIVFAQRQTLTRLASLDDLTRLANRRSFYETADEQLQRLHDAQLEAAVMLVDLDRFKEINDTLGHHTGDALLQEVAARMRTSLPEALALARLGGDEYAALLLGQRGDDWAITAAQRFLSSLDQSVELDGLDLHINASVGVAVRRHGEDRQTLLRQADIAMYRAKGRGGGIEVYCPAHAIHTREHVELASELGTALHNDEIRLHYQPKVDILTDTTHGVEALIRWQHPVHGLLLPERFVPIAERHGLMRKLTLRVLMLALQQAQQWQRAGRELRIAVNLAPESLLDARFPDEVLEMLGSTGVSARMLQLEITENTLLIDPERILQAITRLGEAGLKFALDDYGTGYSSLAYLSILPIDELKIDRSFVSNLVSDENNVVIVRSTIQMARELGFHVVAEGVEDHATRQQLFRFGCDTAQGNYLSPPLPAAELEEWIDIRSNPPATARSLRL